MMINNSCIVFLKPKILKMLFQTDEFNLLDIVAIDKNQPGPNKLGYAFKAIKKNDFFIERHNGYYPATIMAEAVAQTAQMVALHFYPELANEKIGFFDLGRPLCRKPVMAGDALNIEAEIWRRRPGIFQYSGKITNPLHEIVMEIKNARCGIIHES
jgi:3-hydroxymyristoyl/3-hydroxydecanoyl-(acyl carrier protein) dehydratase